MALIDVTHTPTPAKARQFDGTLEAMLDILNARPRDNVVVTLTFNPAGDFSGLNLSGGQIGSLALTIGDWVVVPDDINEQPMQFTNSHATTYWQAS